MRYLEGTAKKKKALVLTAVYLALLAAPLFFPLYLFALQPLAAGVLAALFMAGGTPLGLFLSAAGFCFSAGTGLFTSFAGLSFPEMLLGTLNLTGGAIFSGAVIGMMLRRLKSLQGILVAGALAAIFSILLTFGLDLFRLYGAVNSETIALSLARLTDQMVELMSLATNQTALEVRPLVKSKVEIAMTVLPGSLVVLSLLSSFCALFFAKFLCARIFGIETNFLLPIAYFKVSRTGGIVFLLSLFATLFIEDGFLTAVLSNFITIMAAPLMLSALGLGFYFLKRAAAPQAGRVGCLTLGLFLLIPFLFQVAGFISAIGAVDAIFDYRKLIKK